MARVIIIGAGGHAQVVADILLRMRDAGSPAAPIGFLDDDASLEGRLLLGIPVLGPVQSILDLPYEHAIVAIGQNRTRALIAGRMHDQRVSLTIAMHPRATCAPDVITGQGTMVCAGAVVNTGTWIGENVILNTGCTVDHHNKIGDHAHIAPGANLGGAVTVGEGALVGIGATVMPGRSIGAWSVVGAGAVVTRDIPDGVTVVGAPARIVESRTSRSI